MVSGSDTDQVIYVFTKKIKFNNRNVNIIVVREILIANLFESNGKYKKYLKRNLSKCLHQNLIVLYQGRNTFYLKKLVAKTKLNEKLRRFGILIRTYAHSNVERAVAICTVCSCSV